VKRTEEKEPSEKRNLGVDGRKMLKFIFKKWAGEA
jgi:hypothetical protein